MTPPRARSMLRSTLLLLPLIVAACGGGSSASSAASTTSTTAAGGAGANGAAFQAYRDCLSQHGVTLPQGGAGGSAGGGRPGGGGASGGGRPTPALPAGVTQATFDAAQQACASVRPTGGLSARGGARGALPAAYLSCLADHGVAVSTTTTTAPGATGTPAGPAFDRNDPKFASANQVCAALLPARPAGSTTTTAAPGQS